VGVNRPLHKARINLLKLVQPLPRLAKTLHRQRRHHALRESGVNPPAARVLLLVMYALASATRHGQYCLPYLR
jgi:hypothetical protein